MQLLYNCWYALTFCNTLLIGWSHTAPLKVSKISIMTHQRDFFREKNYADVLKTSIIINEIKLA